MLSSGAGACSPAHFYNVRALLRSEFSISRDVQSPIDIQTAAATTAPELDNALEPHIKKHVPLLFNTGHYFELDTTEPAHKVRLDGEATARIGSGAKGWSKILNSTYKFYQVHWHAPSENKVDGTQYAMEAHFVHQLDVPSLVGTNEKLGVIALLYQLSDTCNPQLEQFWARLPMAPGDAPFGEEVDLGAWLAPLLSGGYYYWPGSLTTPPCSEGVAWAMLRRTSFVCPSQVDRLQRSLREMQEGIGVNNRVVQPLHARVVKASTAAKRVEAAQLQHAAQQLPQRWSGWMALAIVGGAVIAHYGLRHHRRRSLTRRITTRRSSPGDVTSSGDETARPLCLA